MAPGGSRWNHSTHYLPILLDAVRPGCTALDVGCGEGHATRALATAGAAQVTGVDGPLPR
jgi:2-polyprenyl-3-methyl-5-hydroxy-6-metoxy-1,4-benzoquinol methylase